MGNDGTVSLVVGLLVGGLIGFGSAISIETGERKDIQAKAIEKGYAEYKVSQKSGKIVFEWKGDK